MKKAPCPPRQEGAETAKEVETMIDEFGADVGGNPVDRLIRLVLALMGVSDDG